MILELNTRLIEPDITVFGFVGKLTLGNALMDAERTVQKRIESGSRKIVLDLSQLSLIDSAGIVLDHRIIKRQHTPASDCPTTTKSTGHGTLRKFIT